MSEQTDLRFKYETFVQGMPKAHKKLHELIFKHAEELQGYIAQAFRLFLGQEAYDQRIFTQEERARRVQAMLQCAYDPDNNNSEKRHEAWCAMHKASGWKYGPKFKPSAKEHPNLVPWSELPKDARIKADVFGIIAGFAADVFSLAVNSVSRDKLLNLLRLISSIDLEGDDEAMPKQLAAIKALTEGDAEPFASFFLAEYTRELKYRGVLVPSDALDVLDEMLQQ